MPSSKRRPYLRGEAQEDARKIISIKKKKIKKIENKNDAAAKANFDITCRSSTMRGVGGWHFHSKYMSLVFCSPPNPLAGASIRSLLPTRRRKMDTSKRRVELRNKKQQRLNINYC